MRQALTSAQEVGDNGECCPRTTGLNDLSLPAEQLEPSIPASQYAQWIKPVKIFMGVPERMLRRIGRLFQYGVGTSPCLGVA
jgi:hypothetical protein